MPLTNSKKITSRGALVTLLFFCFFITTHQAFAATYTVTKTADTTDGSCGATCSLRDAVTAANADSTADTINFNIPTSDGGYHAASGGVQAYWTLPLSSLLSLTNTAGITVNGYSQTGASRNTTAFGGTINTVLTVQITYSGSGDYEWELFGSNNHLTGIDFAGGTAPGSETLIETGSNSDWIEGNFFGTDITGMTAASSYSGVQQSGTSTSDVIGNIGNGADEVGQRNLFVPNNSLQGSINVTQANNLVIAGNYFGTNATGRACMTAGSPTMGRQQIIGNGNNMQIGTLYTAGIPDTEESNIISCVNNSARAEIRFGGNNDLLQGNYIGTDPEGDNLAPLAGETGAYDSSTVTNLTIKGNTVAYNQGGGLKFSGTGVVITQNTVYDNTGGGGVNSGAPGDTISQNSIYSNTGGIGIDVTGSGVPLANTPGDLVSTMNYPVITEAGISGSNLLIKANLDFNPANAPYILEFFDNAALDPSGYGQGQYYIGSVTTSSIGNGIILTVPITGHVPTAISKITSTATDALGNTSEFSAASTDPTLYTWLGVPLLTTGSATAVTTDQATLTGNITSTGGSNPTVEGINYGTTTGYGSVSSTTGSFSAGTFTGSLTGLTCNATYDYEAFATNAAGTGIGSNATFTTSTCPVPVAHGGSAAIVSIAPAGLDGQPLSFTITNQEGTTLTLSLNADPSIVKGYAVGIAPDLSDSQGILPYASQVTYTLPDTSAHTIYLKYYSTTGVWSPIISHSTVEATVSTITNTVTTTATSSPTIFSRTLKRGSKGSDVLALQQFLNTHEFIISTNGAGSPGNETTFYGVATANAVTKLQNANAAAILTPNGLTNGTGIFGPVTIKFVNSILLGTSE